MVWVDGAYRGALLTYGAGLGLLVEVVAKLADQVGFKVFHGLLHRRAGTGEWWEGHGDG